MQHCTGYLATWPFALTIEIPGKSKSKCSSAVLTIAEMDFRKFDDVDVFPLLKFKVTAHAQCSLKGSNFWAKSYYNHRTYEKKNMI